MPKRKNAQDQALALQAELEAEYRAGYAPVSPRKYKVAELTGDLLDAAVALADGRLVVKDEPGWPKGDYKKLRAEYGGRHVVRWYGTAGDLGGWGPLDDQGSPSTDWSIGGPILDRMTPCDLYSVVRNFGRTVDWHCGVFVKNERSVLDGPTPLIAAMRAYVFAKLGPEVDLPA